MDIMCSTDMRLQNSAALSSGSTTTSVCATYSFQLVSAILIWHQDMVLEDVTEL